MSSAGDREEVFGAAYARSYDALYHEKDYAAECDFLEQVFSRQTRRPSTILDLGCGTGGHLFPLLERGYQVTGVDRAAGMLAAAREQALARNVVIDVQSGDIRELALGRTFDTVISMFAVMGYQTTNRDFARACDTARRHLEPGGLFVFDVWYGPAVLADRPGQRVRVITRSDRRLIRVTEPRLDVEAHIVDIGFHLWVLEGDRLVTDVKETHRMRFFFPQELALFLEHAGFSRPQLFPFLAVDGRLGTDTWNVTVATVAA